MTSTLTLNAMTKKNNWEHEKTASRDSTSRNRE